MSSERRKRKAARRGVSQAARGAAEAAPCAGSPVVGSLQSIAWTGILALFLMTFSIQAFEVPSQSMENTLLIGERLLADKVAYAPREGGVTARERVTTLLPHRDIQRGDIIIFNYPVNPSAHYVKRVVGLPGDRLRLIGRQVQVNGRLLDEGYVVCKLGGRDAYRDDFPAVPPAAAHSEVWAPWAEALPRHVRDGWLVVPPGHYFAMGDNRDESSDSRYWGFVPRENVVGRPLLILWSLDATRADFAYNSQWEWAAGFARRILLLPFKARWNRMFLPIN